MLNEVEADEGGHLADFGGPCLFGYTDLALRSRCEALLVMIDVLLVVLIVPGAI